MTPELEIPGINAKFQCKVGNVDFYFLHLAKHTILVKHVKSYNNNKYFT